MVFTAYYDTVADADLATLLRWSQFDERIYDVVARRGLMPKVFAMLPDPDAARFLARGMCYGEVNQHMMTNLVGCFSKLVRYDGFQEGAMMAELVGAASVPEANRAELFNFSESYRHMILSRNLFAQRAVLRLMAYLFSDDFLGDAVAVLQYKSDILNHVNRVFVDTTDFFSWRYSVRVMALAGGYNEDRRDVNRTERFCHYMARAVPEFVFYWMFAFTYALVRHRPARLKGIVPLWLSRSRARFSATVCATVGVASHTVLDQRVSYQRQIYELKYASEMRRRKAAQRKGTAYEENPFFDTLTGITRRVWTIQLQHYGAAGLVLGLSMLPTRFIVFPKFMGDVVWRHDWVPRWFPVLVGQYTSSKALIPYIVFPFVAGSAATAAMRGATPYDFYVHCRYQWWLKYRAAESVEVPADTRLPPR